MTGDDDAGDGNDDVHGDRKGKSARCAVFATWLLETFGKESLSRGAGVIDVAGGRGELSFELAESFADDAGALGWLTRMQRSGRDDFMVPSLVG